MTSEIDSLHRSNYLKVFLWCCGMSSWGTAKAKFLFIIIYACRYSADVICDKFSTQPDYIKVVIKFHRRSNFVSFSAANRCFAGIMIIEDFPLIFVDSRRSLSLYNVNNPHQVQTSNAWKVACRRNRSFVPVARASSVKCCLPSFSYSCCSLIC